MIPDGGIKNFIDKDTSFIIEKYDEGIYRNKTHVHLDGIKVFNFTLKEVAKNVKNLLKHFDKSIEDVDYAVLHQANKMINELVRKRLKLPPEKLPYSIHKLGNTSCASIPITMVFALSEELRKQKLKLVFSGFGVGLSWGSVYAETENLVVTEMLYI
jgi:3-oxoacyl-[acyl-carrier-protein] synthase-3